MNGVPDNSQPVFGKNAPSLFSHADGKGGLVCVA
jgi:hypothetical protein